MLQAIDERLSIWGWQTGTGIRFAIIVDLWGKEGRKAGSDEGGDGKKVSGRGPGDADLRAVSSTYLNEGRLNAVR